MSDPRSDPLAAHNATWGAQARKAETDASKPNGHALALDDKEARDSDLKPSNESRDHNRSDFTPLLCEHALPHPISSIPPRQWAYGKFLLFGSASVIGAVDGGGKGANAVIIALSMITGGALLGEHVWRKGPVAIVTYEDGETEWRRRIAAACLHYGINYEIVIGSFHFISRPGSRVCFAAPGPRGVVFPDGDTIIKQLKAIGAVLLIVDPLNHAHNLEDGNNNVIIAKVAGEVTRVAQESDVAALVLHHLREGSTGDPDDLMGALSLRATFRACRILARMTTKEAEGLGLPSRQAWRYSRIAGTKENYAPPPEIATWYRLESVALNNGSELYSDGDDVQVSTVWTPPAGFEGLSLNVIAEIFAALRIIPGPALRYSPDRRSAEWIGIPIARITGKTPAETARIVLTWRKNGVLLKGEYDHPTQRKPRSYVTLDEAKAAEILELLHLRLETGE